MYGAPVNLSLPANRVAVKICGLTNQEDALAAVEAGADMLGFNTWIGTKRHIDLKNNAAWIASLPVIRIALLVNATLPEAAKIAEVPLIDALQLHGDEDEDYCAAAAALGKPIIKAIRAKDAASFRNADCFSTPHILLDAMVPGTYGGTGSRLDTGLVRQFQSQFPRLTLWIAGGLTPENVADATTAIRPAAVDVSSGVEREVGRKDMAKMRAFVAEAQKSA